MAKLSAGKQALLVIAGFVLAFSLAWSAYETWFYRAAIPAKIELTFGLATTGNDVGWFERLLPIRIEPCGGAIFGLTSATVAAIQQDGLAFFKDATQGRGRKQNGQTIGFEYEPWQESPLEESWTRFDKPWLGLQCMGLWNYYQVDGIVKVAQAPGSFYAVGRNRMLLIIPSQKLAVYTFRH